MIKLIINLLSKTIGSWSFPFVDKKFNLNHYFQIESRLSELSIPFAIGIVTTYGHGSNILIHAAQFISKDKRKRKSKKTHALAIVETKNGKFRAAEEMGPGLREVTLLSSIGQRDEVLIRVPNPRLVNDKVASYALEYIRKILAIDRIKNVEYDNDHNLENDDRMDCSELIYHALSYGFDKAGQKNLIKTVRRGGKKSWAPVEAQFSELFIDAYDSKKGFV